MEQLLEYKCPNCGGVLEFNSTIQKMLCPFCDSSFEVDDIKAFNEAVKNEQPEDMSWDSEAGGEWQKGETDGMFVYTCQSCGGEVVGDSTTAASNCPYCDSPIIMKAQFAGDLRPDCVIPFKLDKAAAKKAFSAHLTGKRLLPKIFKDQNHIDEIKGVYVPFWLFDTDANADIRYKATRTRLWSDANYNYTETSEYLILRSGSLGFNRVPVDGSSKMPDDLMESIEPFDFSEAVDFKTAYLSGYMADRYDIDAQSSTARANERVKNSTEQAFISTVTGYNTVTPQSSNIRLSDGSVKYALYPVWLLNTTWNNQKFTFAMNGQTGKFVGNLPVDKGAFFRWFGLITAITTVVCFGAYTLFQLL